MDDAIGVPWKMQRQRPAPSLFQIKINSNAPTTDMTGERNL